MFSELEVAGSIAGESMQMVRCEHSDLLVPADAEMVIETVVDLNEMVSNTLGEFGAQYGTETAPLSEVTAITQRRDAMFLYAHGWQGSRTQQLRLFDYLWFAKNS